MKLQQPSDALYNEFAPAISLMGLTYFKLTPKLRRECNAMVKQTYGAKFYPQFLKAARNARRALKKAGQL